MDGGPTRPTPNRWRSAAWEDIPLDGTGPGRPGGTWEDIPLDARLVAPAPMPDRPGIADRAADRTEEWAEDIPLDDPDIRPAGHAAGGKDAEALLDLTGPPAPPLPAPRPGPADGGAPGLDADASVAAPSPSPPVAAPAAEPASDRSIDLAAALAALAPDAVAAGAVATDDGQADAVIPIPVSDPAAGAPAALPAGTMPTAAAPDPAAGDAAGDAEDPGPFAPAFVPFEPVPRDLAADRSNGDDRRGIVTVEAGPDAGPDDVLDLDQPVADAEIHDLDRDRADSGQQAGPGRTSVPDPDPALDPALPAAVDAATADAPAGPGQEAATAPMAAPLIGQASRSAPPETDPAAGQAADHPAPTLAVPWDAAAPDPVWDEDPAPAGADAHQPENTAHTPGMDNPGIGSPRAEPTSGGLAPYQPAYWEPDGPTGAHDAAHADHPDALAGVGDADDPRAGAEDIDPAAWAANGLDADGLDGGGLDGGGLDGGGLDGGGLDGGGLDGGGPDGGDETDITASDPVSWDAAAVESHWDAPPVSGDGDPADPDQGEAMAGVEWTGPPHIVPPIPGAGAVESAVGAPTARHPDHGDETGDTTGLETPPATASLDEMADVPADGRATPWPNPVAPAGITPPPPSAAMARSPDTTADQDALIADARAALAAAGTLWDDVDQELEDAANDEAFARLVALSEQTAMPAGGDSRDAGTASSVPDTQDEAAAIRPHGFGAGDDAMPVAPGTGAVADDDASTAPPLDALLEIMQAQAPAADATDASDATPVSLADLVPPIGPETAINDTDDAPGGAVPETQGTATETDRLRYVIANLSTGDTPDAADPPTATDASAETTAYPAINAAPDAAGLDAADLDAADLDATAPDAANLDATDLDAADLDTAAADLDATDPEAADPEAADPEAADPDAEAAVVEPTAAPDAAADSPVDDGRPQSVADADALDPSDTAQADLDGTAAANADLAAAAGAVVDDAGTDTREPLSLSGMEAPPLTDAEPLAAAHDDGWQDISLDTPIIAPAPDEWEEVDLGGPRPAPADTGGPPAAAAANGDAEANRDAEPTAAPDDAPAVADRNGLEAHDPPAEPTATSPLPIDAALDDLVRTSVARDAAEVAAARARAEAVTAPVRPRRRVTKARHWLERRRVGLAVGILLLLAAKTLYLEGPRAFHYLGF